MMMVKVERKGIVTESCGSGLTPGRRPEMQPKACNVERMMRMAWKHVANPCKMLLIASDETRHL